MVEETVASFSAPLSEMIYITVHRTYCDIIRVSTVFFARNLSVVGFPVIRPYSMIIGSHKIVREMIIWTDVA